MLGKQEKENTSNYDLLDESLGQILHSFASLGAEELSPGKTTLNEFFSVPFKKFPLVVWRLFQLISSTLFMFGINQNCQNRVAYEACAASEEFIDN